MDTATVPLTITLLVLPIACAFSRGAVWPALGLLVGWILFGLAIEMSLISCRPGWEPLGSITMFFMSMPLFALPWLAVFGVTKAILSRFG